MFTRFTFRRLYFCMVYQFDFGREKRGVLFHQVKSGDVVFGVHFNCNSVRYFIGASGLIRRARFLNNFANPRAAFNSLLSDFFDRITSFNTATSGYVMSFNCHRLRRYFFSFVREARSVSRVQVFVYFCCVMDRASFIYRPFCVQCRARGASEANRYY